MASFLCSFLRQSYWLFSSSISTIFCFPFRLFGRLFTRQTPTEAVVLPIVSPPPPPSHLVVAPRANYRLIHRPINNLQSIVNGYSFLTLLRHLPLRDQIEFATLTYRVPGGLRWVNLGRRSLFIWYLDDENFNGFFRNGPFLDNISQPLTMRRYTEYWRLLSQPDNQMDRLPPGPNFYQLHHLSPTVSLNLSHQFVGVAHLSVWNVDVHIDTLNRLLRHYQQQLHALHLGPKLLSSPSLEQRAPLWEILNEMVALQKLYLVVDRIDREVQLSAVIPALLPRLTELQLDGGEHPVDTVTYLLNEGHLRRLSLWETRWATPDLLFNETNVRLNRITHLKLTGVDSDGADPHNPYNIDQHFLRRTVDHFRFLIYLHLYTDVPLHLMLESLHSLLQLQSLRVDGPVATEEDGLVSFIAPPIRALTHAALLELSIPSLAVLSLSSVRIQVSILPHILPVLFPHLRQFHHEDVEYTCDCPAPNRNGEAIQEAIQEANHRLTHFSLPLREERHGECICLHSLTQTMHRFLGPVAPIRVAL